MPVDSESEDEVFFGEDVSFREKTKTARLAGRRTLLFVKRPAAPVNRAIDHIGLKSSRSVTNDTSSDIGADSLDSSCSASGLVDSLEDEFCPVEDFHHGGMIAMGRKNYQVNVPIAVNRWPSSGMDDATLDEKGAINLLDSNTSVGKIATAAQSDMNKMEIAFEPEIIISHLSHTNKPEGITVHDEKLADQAKSLFPTELDPSHFAGDSASNPMRKSLVAVELVFSDPRCSAGKNESESESLIDAGKLGSTSKARESYFSNLKLIDVNESSIIDGFMADTELSVSGDSGLFISSPCSDFINVFPALVDKMPVYTAKTPAFKRVGDWMACSPVTPPCKTFSKSVESNLTSELNSADSMMVCVTPHSFFASCAASERSENGSCETSSNVSAKHSSVESYGFGDKGMLCSTVSTESVTNSREVTDAIRSFCNTKNLIVGEDLNDLSVASNNSEGNCQGDQVFNDTIEEMELLLKYGVNYGEEPAASECRQIASTDSVTSPNEADIPVTVKKRIINVDESIVSPVRKTSVDSTFSLFLPNLDSTRSSLLGHKCIKSPNVDIFHEKSELELTVLHNSSDDSIESENNRAPVMSVIIKGAPAKPPRNTVDPCPSIGSDISAVGAAERIPTVTNSKPISKLPQPTVNKKHPPLLPMMSVVSKAGTAVQFSSKLKAPTNKFNTPVKNAVTNAPFTHSGKKSLPPRPTSSVKRYNHISTPQLQLNTKKFTKRDTASPGLHTLKSPSLQRINTPSPVVSRESCHKSLSVQRLYSPALHNSPALHHFNANNKVSRPPFSIASPLSKYLAENPPPPLVQTIKPRYNISPAKMMPPDMTTHRVTVLKCNKVHGTPQKADMNFPVLENNHNLDSTVMQQETTLKRIDDNMEILTSKVSKVMVNDVAEYAAVGHKNSFTEKQINSYASTSNSVLPVSNYASAVVFTMENKENDSSVHRREIPSNRPPVTVMKHAGRMKISKADCNELSSSKKFKEPSHLPIRSSVRHSLMEVSIYEPSNIHRTNTLH